MKNELKFVFYINGFFSLLGVVSYLLEASFLSFHFLGEKIYYSDFVDGFIIFLVFGFTIGVIVALGQVLYGLYGYLIKRDKNIYYKHSLFGALLWGSSVVIFFIGLANGLIVSV